MSNSTEPAKILLVDDEPSIRAMLQAVLESDNYQVATAVSAADAMRKLGEREFDVVITDMRMETAISGFDVVHAARKRSDRVVVIIVTAFPVSDNNWRGEGVDAALSKPVPIVEMLQTINELLNARRQLAG